MEVNQDATCAVCGEEIPSFRAELNNWDEAAFDTLQDGAIAHGGCVDVVELMAAL